MPKNNNDNVFVTTEIFSEVQWSQKESDQRRLSVNLLNQNGLIIFIQKRGENGFRNAINFWRRQDDMPIIVDAMEAVLKSSGDSEVLLEGNKSNLYFIKKENKGKTHYGLKIVKKNDGNETSEYESFAFNTKKISTGKTIGRIKFKALKTAIEKTYYRQSTSYRDHFRKYFEEIEKANDSGSDNTDSNEDNDNTVPF